MAEGMPDFAMPSDAELERSRAQTDDEARERDARVETLAAEDARVPASPASARSGASSDRSGASSAHAEGSGMRGLLALARNPLATFVAGAALVGGAFVAVPVIQRHLDAGSMADLDRVVTAYVAAVESGDFATATDMVQPDEAYAEMGLLDAAAPVALADIDCEEPRVDDDRATVSCSVATPLHGPGSRIRLELVRDGGWRLDRGFAVASPLLVSLALVEDVGGAQPPEGSVPSMEPVWLYPADYELGLVEPVGLRVDGTGLAVTGDGAMWFGGITPTETLEQEALEAALAYLAACAATSASGCPERSDPLVDGERYEAMVDAFSYGPSERILTIGVGVRVVGGSPATWPLHVDVSYDAGLQTYELVPSTQPEL